MVQQLGRGPAFDAKGTVVHWELGIAFYVGAAIAITEHYSAQERAIGSMCCDLVRGRRK